MDRFFLTLTLVSMLGCSEYDIKDMSSGVEDGVEEAAAEEEEVPKETPPMELDEDSGTVADPPEDEPEPDIEEVPETEDDPDPVDEEPEPEPEDDESVPGPPDIDVSTRGVAFERICTAGEEEVVVKNIGESPLQILDVLVSGTGWAASHPGLPAILSPGATYIITLEGSEGVGMLTIVSDDPVDPELDIPLSATVDAPPTLTIETPSDGAVLSTESLTSFQARVNDAEDAVEGLLVEWTDASGSLLSGGFADASGLSVFNWAADSVDSGEHSMTASVTDSCGNTVEDTVYFSVPGPPDIEVTPRDVSFDRVCTVGEQTIVVSNRGESALQILDVVISGSGWTAEHDVLPISIMPGESHSLTVEGSDGEGLLTIVSDDPDEPEMDVVLSATADVPPTLTIETPVDGDVLVPGGVTSFEAQVSDDTDAATDLLVEWTDASGVLLAEDFADGAGRATFDWRSESTAGGAYSITASVTDSCGNTVEDTVDFSVIGPPNINVSPREVLFEGVCTAEEDVVIITNVGESTLQIFDVVVSGSGWTADHGVLPVNLVPGAAYEIAVEGSYGGGTLTIVSDDPDEPSLEVRMLATPNTPPALNIETPIDGDILSPGAETTFFASVSDDIDSSTDLLVEWSDSSGAVVGGGFADASGLATFAWVASEMGSGEQSVTARVTDSCGYTVEDTVYFCQNEGYTEDSIDLESWHFEGSARWDAERELVELTEPINTQAGTAFQTSAVVSSDSISIEFDFYVSGGSGADGISLTALDVDRMTTFVGGTGGGIGYVGLPGWSVEIDTWFNSEHSDPTTGDHVSFHLDGDINTPLAWAELPEMEDEEWHRALIEMEGDYVRVLIDDVVYIDQTIPGLVPFDAYVGFTAATGGSTNWHRIDALDVEGFVCDE